MRYIPFRSLWFGRMKYCSSLNYFDASVGDGQKNKHEAFAAGMIQDSVILSVRQSCWGSQYALSCQYVCIKPFTFNTNGATQIQFHILDKIVATQFRGHKQCLFCHFPWLQNYSPQSPMHADKLLTIYSLVMTNNCLLCFLKSFVLMCLLQVADLLQAHILDILILNSQKGKKKGKNIVSLLVNCQPF